MWRAGSRRAAIVAHTCPTGHGLLRRAARVELLPPLPLNSLRVVPRAFVSAAGGQREGNIQGAPRVPLRPQAYLQQQRGFAAAAAGGGGRRRGRGGAGNNAAKPPPPPPEEGEEDEEGILFDEEDDEGMAEFLAEYEELGREAAEAGEGPPLVVEEYRLEEDGEGEVTMVRTARKSPASEAAVGELLREAKRAGAMTEDDWFEFLRRIGAQRAAEEEPPPEVEREKGPAPKRRKHPRKGRSKFVDRVCIAVSGGKGGKGCISFESVGGAGGVKRPSGGHGGEGGDVVFVADPRVQTLEMDRHHFHAKDGANGDSNAKRGARGTHTLIRVPLGTVVKEVRRVVGEDCVPRFDRVEVADLDEPMAFHTAAKGGRPGLGNSIQAGRTRKATSASGAFRSPGHQGERRYYELELKTIADVGLVGYPNAGKSTLLGGLSRARPKVAPYPFTTLHPTVGRVEFTDAVSLTVADLPGLIEGAHANKGLGHEFLRHIERTKVLLYVLDGLGGSRGDATTPLSEDNDDGSVTEEPPDVVLRKLREELEMYRPGLAARPSLVWINKADVDPAAVARTKAAVAAVLAEEAGQGEGRKVPIMVGSAKTGERIGELAGALRMTLAELVALGKEGDEGEGRGGGGMGGGPEAERKIGGARGGGGAGAAAAAGGKEYAMALARAEAEAARRALAMQNASAKAKALDETHAHQVDWAAAMSAAVAQVHRARCFAAAYEVVRRQNVYLGWAMTDVGPHELE